jgi:hypothetical protein
MFGISQMFPGNIDGLKGSEKGKHSVKTCTLDTNNQVIGTLASSDCRAFGIAYRNQDISHHHPKLLPIFMTYHM